MLREIIKSDELANSTGTMPTLTETPGLAGGDILSMGVSMFIVVGVIIVLGWLYSRSRYMGRGTSNVINVVATRVLGPKERLLVVEVAEQQLLVGMTAAGVQTLHVLEKPVCSAEAVADGTGFASRLRSAFREIGK